MSGLFSPLTRAARLAREAWDLGTLWWLLVLVQPFVPLENPLAREDLAPWMTLTLSLALLLRGRAIGDGPHPMLSARRTGWGAWFRRVGAALLPTAMLCTYDAGALGSAARAGIGAGVAAAGAFLMYLGRSDGESAWEPEEAGPMRWVGLALGAALGSAAAGALGSSAVLVGLGFGVCSLTLGRPENLAQRKHAGRRDRRPWRARLFPFALAFGGPVLALSLLQGLGRAFFGPSGFALAFLGALFVSAWAAVVWPRPRPLARYVLLHEVVPVGGRDERAEEGAVGFDAPPEGALRLDPLSVRRTRQVHPWVVPVRDARIGELDDPVRPLWARHPAPLPSHVLGEAAFQPDPRGRSTQDEEITVALRGNREMATLRGGDVQSRRLVVLRAFAPPGSSRRPAARTWRWERGVPAACLQIVDANTTALRLRDGDILVLSTEGVARAFEVELGEGIYAGEEPSPPRPPQIEDYCGVST